MTHIIDGKKYDFVISPDGSGDFRTWRECFAAMLESPWWVWLWRTIHRWEIAVYVKPGIYIENCTFESDGPAVRFTGAR